jgi:hypothetical protein
MKLEVLIMLSVFLLGFLSCYTLNYFDDSYEIPVLRNIGFGNFDLDAPSDFVRESDIEVLDDRVVIYLDDASLSAYASTGSMVPVFNENANGIRVRIRSVDEISAGDIITFREGEFLIVHRVIEKGVDSEGVYFITKGDNNNIDDGKIRFEDVKYKTVGVIW